MKTIQKNDQKDGKSFLIEWEYKNWFQLGHFHVYMNSIYVGTSITNAFLISSSSSFSSFNHQSSNQVTVQAVSNLGFYTPIQQCPIIILN